MNSSTVENLARFTHNASWNDIYDVFASVFEDFYRKKTGVDTSLRPNHSFQNFKILISKLLLVLVLEKGSKSKQSKNTFELSRDSLKKYETLFAKHFPNDPDVGIDFADISDIFYKSNTIQKVELEFLSSIFFNQEIDLIDNSNTDINTEGPSQNSDLNFNSNAKLFSKPSRFFHEVV